MNDATRRLALTFTALTQTAALSGLLVLASLAIGCGEGGVVVSGAGHRFQALIEGSPESAQVLAVVNSATFEVLDIDAGLDVRAATNILAHRQGPDALDGTVDDDRFDTLAELDAVPYVGASALDRLTTYALSLEQPRAVHGIIEGSRLAEGVLLLVNVLDLPTLDDSVGLDARAAANLVTHRAGNDGLQGTDDDDLIDDLDELDAISYFGATAFGRLRDFAEAEGHATDSAIARLRQGFASGSLPAGSAVEAEGIVTAVLPYGVFLQAPEAGHDGGLFVFTEAAPPAGLLRGDGITVIGTLVDFHGLLELSAAPSALIVTPGLGELVPLSLAPFVLADPRRAERFEGMLVQVEELEVVADLDWGDWQLEGGVVVDDMIADLKTELEVRVGEGFASVAGPLTYNFGAYKLAPRDAADALRAPPPPCTFIDADGDGANACDDCDDADPTRRPGAPELCDGIDNDCDGSARYESDADADGLLDCGGCAAAGFFPGVAAAADAAALVDALDAANEVALCGYTDARELLFTSVDNVGGEILDVYTGRTMSGVATYLEADGAGFNTEHTWPQSQGATGQARCDLHHLFITDAGANSMRSSFPFGEVVSLTWSEGESQLGLDAAGALVFAPPAAHRGNLARAMFHFATEYRGQLTASQWAFFQGQVPTLVAWAAADPVDAEERERNSEVAAYQGTRNAYVACEFVLPIAASAF